ncbi:GspE/PulE family protein [Patescibacteria group bacterium]
MADQFFSEDTARMPAADQAAVAAASVPQEPAVVPQSVTAVSETVRSQGDTTSDLLQNLVSNGLLTQDQQAELVSASQTEGLPVEQIIRDRKLVDEEGLVQARAKVLGLPYINLSTLNIQKDILNELPKDVAQNYQILVFEKAGEILRIGVVNPEDFRALEAIEFLAEKNQLKTEIYMISQTSFASGFQQYETLQLEVKEALGEAEDRIDLDELASGIDVKEVQEVVTEAPISKTVAVIIKHAVEGRASDIHIEPLESQIRVRYRVDGIMYSTLDLPKHILPEIVSRIKILANLKIDEKRLPQDGRFRSTVGQKRIDFRVSTFPTVNGEKVVLRVLDRTAGIATFEDLGLVGSRRVAVNDAIHRPYGMMLMTGPTGSGKTTTLYSAISVINKIDVNIVTLEDPVEYYLEGIAQAQIKEEIGLTFANGLRSILRQDPDIIMLGEIRDGETAQIAVNSALTGHLVLSTLHTNSAAGALPRLVDLGVEPFLLASSVNLMAAQRLVRRICDSCKKQSVAPAPKIAEYIKEEYAKLPDSEKQQVPLPDPIRIIQAEKCGRCGGTGYQGRIAIFETIPFTDTLKETFLDKPSTGVIERQSRTEGNISMIQDGILKIIQGYTTVEEVIRVTKA